MNRTTILLLGSLALSGCGAKWSIPNAKFFKFQNKDVRIAAKIFLSEKGLLGEKGGADLEMRLLTGAYGAVLTEKSTRVGEGLNDSEVPEIGTVEITDFRLGGTPNTYQNLCAEIRMDNSNLEDWTRLGCVHFTDTPSESPTGGVEEL